VIDFVFQVRTVLRRRQERLEVLENLNILRICSLLLNNLFQINTPCLLRGIRTKKMKNKLLFLGADSHRNPEKRILKSIFFYVTSNHLCRKLGKIPARIAYYQQYYHNKSGCKHNGYNTMLRKMVKEGCECKSNKSNCNYIVIFLP